MSAAPVNMDFSAPPVVARLQGPALAVGVIASLLAIVVAWARHDSAMFFRSYLLAYLWWTGITLGCLAVLMMQHLTGGLWGFVIRRPLESAVRNLPLMLVLFVPLIFGFPTLYKWANADIVAHDEILQHQSAYLSPRLVIARWIIYFVAWLALAHFLNRWSDAQDTSRSLVLRRRLQSLSGPGLVIYVLTVTFASIDWLMSLDAHWGSTIYGFLVIAGQVLAALSFSAAVVFLLTRQGRMAEIVQQKHVHSLGKLMLAFVLLWAYMAYSQLLITWAGNLPDEITFYLHRFRGGWIYVGVALVLFHFVLPFLLLLSRDFKRKVGSLAILAVFLIAMRYLELLWLISPNPLPGLKEGIGFEWMDIALPIGIGGIWLAAFLWQLKRRPLVVLHDSRFEEVVGHARE